MGFSSVSVVANALRLRRFRSRQVSASEGSSAGRAVTREEAPAAV
jgi:hypothetical protein